MRKRARVAGPLAIAPQGPKSDAKQALCKRMKGPMQDNGRSCTLSAGFVHRGSSRTKIVNALCINLQVMRARDH
eukprot:scaffold309419_cov19-Tisochrysis_lutea.AAC.1